MAAAIHVAELCPDPAAGTRAICYSTVAMAATVGPDPLLPGPLNRTPSCGVFATAARSFLARQERYQRHPDDGLREHSLSQSFHHTVPYYARLPRPNLEREKKR